MKLVFHGEVGVGGRKEEGHRASCALVGEDGAGIDGLENNRLQGVGVGANVPNAGIGLVSSHYGVIEDEAVAAQALVVPKIAVSAEDCAFPRGWPIISIVLTTPHAEHLDKGIGLGFRPVVEPGFLDDAGFESLNVYMAEGDPRRIYQVDSDRSGRDGAIGAAYLHSAEQNVVNPEAGRGAGIGWAGKAYANRARRLENEFAVANGGVPDIECVVETVFPEQPVARPNIYQVVDGHVDGAIHSYRPGFRRPSRYGYEAYNPIVPLKGIGPDGGAGAACRQLNG